MAAVTVHSDFEARGNKVCHCFCFFQSICHEVMGLDAMIFSLRSPHFLLHPQASVWHHFSSTFRMALLVTGSLSFI